MFSLTRQVVRPATWAIRYSSSSPSTNHGVAKWQDPGLEGRRAARLAREAKNRVKHASKYKPQKTTGSSTTSASPTPKSKGPGEGRPRKHSLRQHSPSSEPRSGTQRSLEAASRSGAVDSLVALARNQTTPPVAAQLRPSKNDTAFLDSAGIGPSRPPKFTGPEPSPKNIATHLDTIPDVASSLRLLPPPQKLEKMDATSIKRTYGGDYSQYQLNSSSYVNGIREPGSTYAKIILNRNPSIPLGDQRKLVNTIKRLTK